MKKTSKNDCSERSKKRLQKQFETFYFMQIFLVALSGTFVFAFGYQLIYLINSLVENDGLWLGYLIGSLISLSLAIMFLFVTKFIFNKKDKNQRKMKACGVEYKKYDFTI
jgi:cytochrome c biogenesis protein CcdA